MFTQQIILEPVSLSEYDRLQRWERKSRMLYSDDVHCRIQRTFTHSKNYGQLLRVLSEHPFAEVIRVRNGYDWIEESIQNLHDTQFDELAELAEADVHKRNYLELVLERNRERAYLGFGEQREGLVVREIHAHKTLRDLFEVSVTRRQLDVRGFRYVNGIWTSL